MELSGVYDMLKYCESLRGRHLLTAENLPTAQESCAHQSKSCKNL